MGRNFNVEENVYLVLCGSINGLTLKKIRIALPEKVERKNVVDALDVLIQEKAIIKRDSRYSIPKRPLEEVILLYLHHPLTISEIVEKVKERNRYSDVTEEDVRKVIRNLRRKKSIIQINKNKYVRTSIIQPIPIPVIPPSSKIVIPPPTKIFVISQYIAESTNSCTTRKIADDFGWSSPEVYQSCRRLENKEYIRRGDPDKKRISFLPITGEVIHSGNYDRLKRLERQVREIIKEYCSKNDRSLQRLHKLVENKIGKDVLAKYEKRIRSFERELFEICKNAKKKSEVDELLGFRSYNQDIITWESAID